MLATVLALAACSSDVPDSPDTPDGSADGETGQVLDSDSEDAADIVTPSDDPAPPHRDGLVAAWELFHAAWVAQAAADEPDPAAFDDVAVDPDSIVETLTARRGDSRLVTTDAELWPQFNINGQSAEITDCAIVAQHPDGQPDSIATVTTGWEATAVATNDGWRIDTARQLDLFCIADELNEQVLAAYQVWLDGHAAWYQPPDPDHPLLIETMADPGLSDMRDLLTSDRNAGVSMRFPHEAEAAVTEVALGAARVTDCYPAPQGYGAFDTDSGERRTDVAPAPKQDQINRTIADLERTEEGWRVVGWRWEEQNNCAPGETRYAVS